MLDVIFVDLFHFIGFNILIITIGMSISFPFFLIFKSHEERRLAEEARLAYLNKLETFLKVKPSSPINN